MSDPASTRSWRPRLAPQPELAELEPHHPQWRPQGSGSLLRDLAFLATGIVLGVGAMVVIGYRPRPHSPAAALALTRETIVVPMPNTLAADAASLDPRSGTVMAPITAGLPPPKTTVIAAPGVDGAVAPTATGAVPVTATVVPAPTPPSPTTVAGAATGTPGPPGTATAFPRPLPLLLPVQGILPEKLVDTFTQARANGRRHDAIDIMAAEGTPVLAADDGVLTKLFTSKDGGLTLYESAPGGRIVYYYAHLSAYAPGLAPDQPLSRGQLLGFVGHTGNASAAAPHLHFAVYDMPPGAKWWQGQAENPFPLLRAGPAPAGTP